ncbi:MAG: MFS transporter, partial [Ilumatobacter sp.]
LGVLLVARFVWGLGAWAPSGRRVANARALYTGDRMARVVSLFTAAFLIGPIVVPFVGEAILLVGSWRAVFLAGVALAAVAVVWTIRFGETMAPQHRRPIRLSPFAEAFGSVVGAPVTRWSVIATTMFTAQFFTWLGSAQPIFDRVYDRDAQFTIFFGFSGAGMAAALLVSNRLIDRFGVRRVSRSAATCHVAASILILGPVLVADGVPALGWFFGWALLVNAMTMVIGPMVSSLAMEPMAAKAGTASAILGLSQLGFGGLLAAVVDARVGGTVTPLVVGAICFGVPGLGAILLATRAAAPSPEAVSPAAAPS